MDNNKLKKELIIDSNISMNVGFFNFDEQRYKNPFTVAGKYTIQHFSDINIARQYNVILLSLDSYQKYEIKFHELVLNGTYLFLLIDEGSEFVVTEKTLFNDYIYKIISSEIKMSTLGALIYKIESTLMAEKCQDTLIEKYNTVLENFNTMIDIGSSLSEIRDIDKLFDQILSKSREITRADAGSIYLIIKNEKTDENGNKVVEKLIKFEKSQNFSFDLKTPTFTMPITKKSIVGYSALTGVTENIPDAHNIPKDKDYSYSVESEKALKVHNKSVIVTPMLNTHHEIIGVLQLFNKKRNFNANISDPSVFDDQVVPFNDDDIEIVTSFASQAGVTLENSLLYKEINTIFEGFIRASVTAIESRDPTTSGHSGRVALLTAEFARVLNKVNENKYKDVHFSEEQIKYIEYAGLLHDFGKIGVRERVLVKADKLYPNQLEEIKNRFAIIKNMMVSDANIKKLNILNEQGYEVYQREYKNIDNILQEDLSKLNFYYETILKANKPTMMEEDSCNIITELMNKEYHCLSGDTIKFIEQNEAQALLVKRGSLTDDERKEIESHVTHSFEFLKQIPWTKEMSCIPEIAYQHHEKVNGRGYPQGLVDDQISVEAKMMAIVDIYDALTATDRPYKKAAPIEKALEILGYNEKDGSIDSELFRIFKEYKIYEVLNKK